MNFKEAQLIAQLQEVVSNLEIQTNIQRQMIEDLNIKSNRFQKISVEQQDLIERQQILISKIGGNNDITDKTT